MDASLDRLSRIRLSIGGVRAEAGSLKFSWDLLCEQAPIVTSLTESRRTATRRLLRIEFSGWYQRQLAAGSAVLVDWTVLRTLHGLTKRLYVYAEAEKKSGRFSPSFLVLGDRGLATLGLYDRARADAIRALRDAIGRLNSLGIGWDIRLVRRSGQDRIYFHRTKAALGLEAKYSASLRSLPLPRWAEPRLLNSSLRSRRFSST